MSHYCCRHAPLFPIFGDGGGVVKAASLLALPFVLAWDSDLCRCGVFAVELRCHVIMLQRICTAILSGGSVYG